jgi:hypothetical protein
MLMGSQFTVEGVVKKPLENKKARLASDGYVQGNRKASRLKEVQRLVIGGLE